MIGRVKEQRELNKRWDSGEAELVAIYGRRRVGKTCLVDETFRGRITFRYAGLSPVELQGKGLLKAQLEQFYYSLLGQGMPRSHRPKDWLEAFYMLESLLESRDDGQRQLVFMDELPWMDTPRSGFLTAFEGFWNGWACHRPNIMVIVCGSASSWVQDKLLNNHGGLYGRVTCEIHLSPFTLAETERFFEQRSVHLSRYDITQAYMAVGGIPYYLGYFTPDRSLPQNLDQLFFETHAKLSGEFDRLFDSIYDAPKMSKSIVRVLAMRRSGYRRGEIAEKCGLSSGGTLTACLSALIASDFIQKEKRFGDQKGEEYYRLTDPFCLFWLYFQQGGTNQDPAFWEHSLMSPQMTAWRGFAFENICFTHLSQIRQALGISGVVTTCSPWVQRGTSKEKGTQVGLLLERADRVVNACEMKFVGEPFTVDKEYYQTLMHRQTLLADLLSPTQSLQQTLITTFGLKSGTYSGIFSSVITLDDLFRET